MKIEITSFCRLHFGLISMNMDAHRVDGGTGIYLNIPSAKIIIENNDEKIVYGYNKNYFSNLLQSLNRYIQLEGYNVTIENLVEPHTGLGLTTQISLALCQGISILENKNNPWQENIQRIGRGGTSGVGIYSYLYGGYVVDGGHRSIVEKSRLVPSAFNTNHILPPLVLSKKVPAWGVCVIIPHNLKRVSGTLELDLFAKLTPIPTSEIDAICKWILLGIVPAIENEDLDSFGESLDQCMSLGFKKREIAYQGNKIYQYFNLLKDNGFKGVGMSSFGPAVFGFCKDIETALQKKKILETYMFPNDKVYATTIRNTPGCHIEYIDF